MRLTILGSGTVDPQAHRACSGYYLEIGRETVLFDLGNGVVRRGVGLGLPLHEVTKLYLSHLHPDHTADIVPLLFARNYAPPPWSEHSKLKIHGPRGTKAFLESVFSAWPSIAPKDGAPGIEIEEFPDDGFSQQGDDWQMQALRVEHGDMTAFGFRFSERDNTLSYSGDSKLCQGVREVARGADIFVCECSCFPRGCEPLYCREVHLSWEDVAEICDDAKPKQVVLTHLYEPVLARRPNPLDSLQEHLTIPVCLAEDGMELTL